MRAVVQRSGHAEVTVEGRVTGSIDRGLVLLLGISRADGESEAAWMAEKVANLRIFTDDAGKMNRSLLDVGGQVLIVSQFTLYGDARKGRRPSFVRAAEGVEAETVYLATIAAFERLGVSVATGEFGANMDVSLVNEGPVTILVDSEKTF